MAQLSIQPSINDLRSQALLRLIERLGSLDLTPLLVYRLDSTPAGALTMLAWQFDILAPQWQLGALTGESIDRLKDIDVLTDVDSLASSAGTSGQSDADSWRQLLRAAIPLHRTRGTAYSIKTALASLGWGTVTIQEGQNSWSGTSYPASQGWAVFRVIISLARGQGVQASDPARIAGTINFFKPTRCQLDSIWFKLFPLADITRLPIDTVISIFSQNDAAPPPVDLVAAKAWNLTDLKITTALYNNHFYHTGISYGAAEPVVVDSGVTVLGQAISAES
jgi:P2-related tail formation protein